jgi:hypothetical protein
VRVLIVTALITALIGGLCVGGGIFALSRGELEGSGNVVNAQVQLSGVTRVEIDGPGQLVVVQGATESLSITTDDNILERIETEVEDGELAISFERSGFTTLSRIRPTEGIRFELTVPALEEIEVNGSVDVELDGWQGDRLAVEVNGTGDGVLEGLRLDELVVSINGASTFDVAGSVDRQEIEVNGSGRYRAASLSSRETVIEINGDGEAIVRVRETLDVDISGRGRIEYIGSPAITEDISGSGELVRIEDADAPADAATPSATPAAATPDVATPDATRAPSPTPITLDPAGRLRPSPTPD